MLRSNPPIRTVAFAVFFIGNSHLASAQHAGEETVRAATAVLAQTMATPLNRIPQSMLENASGVAIIPNLIKAGFIVGARRGHGLLFIREADGNWHAPVFITLTGGNIGWQVGVQSSDIVLVFKTRRSIDGVLSGKFTIGADAAAAAGPLGRQGSVATDESLRAEIYSYSRSRGLFAGVSIDGSVLQVDRVATGMYYGATAPGQQVTIPPSALQLTQTIAAYAGRAPSSVNLAPQPVYAQQFAAREADILRDQLVQFAPQLFDQLDDQWKSYLALPSSLYVQNREPTVAEVRATMARFDTVAADPRFQQLAARPEFQSVHGLVRTYLQSLANEPSSLQLPPPPSRNPAAMR